MKDDFPGRSDMRQSTAEEPADPGKRKTLKALGALGLLAAVNVGALSSCSRRSTALSSHKNRLIMLGIDGLDAGIASRMMAEGKLPNMARLRDRGGFRPLQTTVPPQSPSAWATVSTGLDAGGHGIYDFFHRDPRRYQLTYSLTQIRPSEHTVPVGRWRVPLSEPQAQLLRKGPAFWGILADRGVPCEVHRVPSNFPPTVDGARQLAGLGVPDLRGSLGECSYFSEDPGDLAKGPRVQAVRVNQGHARAAFRGPRNSLESGAPEVTVEFDLWVDRRSRVAEIRIQEQRIVLREGEWSDWVPIRFPMVPHVRHVTGICRFYLKEADPYLRLYATALNYDPLEPALPIDAPRGFAKQLADQQGRFHTLGLPEDHAALSAGILDDAEYLQQAGHVLAEARQGYEAALNDFDEGVLFCYFGTTDRNQHLFWRCTDPSHPAYDEKDAREYGGVVEDCYRVADELIGNALERCDSRTDLMAFSDHGFAPYRRHVNLNSWLAREGYLSLYRQTTRGTIGQHAEWSQTSAYALGLQSLYVNLRGREARGIVPESGYDRFVEELRGRLRDLRDPDTGQRVISQVYRPQEIYAGSDMQVAPDLIVGCARGYRISFASAGGVVTPAPVEDNAGKWSGDHTLAADLVPGVLFATQPIEVEGPGLIDIAPTVLAQFGVAAPETMSGRPLW